MGPAQGEDRPTLIGVGRARQPLTWCLPSCLRPGAQRGSPSACVPAPPAPRKESAPMLRAPCAFPPKRKRAGGPRRLGGGVRGTEQINFLNPPPHPRRHQATPGQEPPLVNSGTQRPHPRPLPAGLSHLLSGDAAPLTGLEPSRGWAGGVSASWGWCQGPGRPDPRNKKAG